MTKTIKPFPFLPPWKLSGMLTPTRTFGRVGFNKNGGYIDIWIRVNGEHKWFAVRADELASFLASGEQTIALGSESDGNSEGE